ncbi:signal peptide peptidase SppA, 36K type [Gluconacetobacter diazotrophicus PA1 5]|uniref:Signal peptide peptidase SppA n=2 Tax=Gluconacetobacter diazotrophicus TaxID=33996 RepID=A0A7W4I764_GLUDI|nr:signal peptide peptidase SppA [Gluconacetobacter diazotrophicus]ACI52928.1 signal peptide peptidase SppA, 36K type [Gluconacetobacter diazotrophicus PA1 5]MBB2157521.1 signal peptide peptidase SppA [Gluconacetobacter diazotrophicus]TWB08927.1 signal peptide peptidase A [Gluconacetobacter diazotrophicus]CAP57103.1 putative peptidase [Gluconacetobacter diazotrophicus PA1 5]
MATDPDLTVDRLRLRRRLVFWRIAAVASFVLALVGVGGHSLMRSGGFASRDHLVRVRVAGIIGSDNRKLIDLVDKAAKTDSVRGMILAVDSPGGSVSGGEALHDAVARFAARKPVAVTMGGLAASAGYMISVPAQRVFAVQSTLTGSIGVIMEAPDVSGLLDRVGVKVDQLVSGPMKGQPSGTQPLSPEGRQMLQGVVADLFDQFVTMVADGRHMPVERVRTLADGRPYTGRQALSLGLIDQIGDERDAKAWLTSTRHLSGTIPVVDLKVTTGQGWMHRITRSMLGVVFGDEWAGSVLSQGVALDGAVAIWKP